MTIETKIAKNGTVSCKLNGERTSKKTAAVIADRAINNEQVTVISPYGDIFTVSKEKTALHTTMYHFSSNNGDKLDYHFAPCTCTYTRKTSADIIEKAINDIGNIIEVRQVISRIEADIAERKACEAARKAREHVADKIARDAKASDDDNAFDLLPALDELNDVDDEADVEDYAVSAMAQDIATEAEIENAQAANVKEEPEMINISTVTVNDGYTIDTAKVTIDQAVNIISRLNYRNDTFQYRFTTREDHADIKYRHFDAYSQNGDKDAFAISEIVINGKLEIVRFYNLFRDIIVDLHIGNVNCKLGYKGAIELVDEPEAEIAEPVNPERFSATVYYYRPDENGGEPWHGDKYQQFATAADAANFIIKFAAEHYDYTITTDSNIRDWDNRKQYWLTDADINALDADAFVKTTRQAAALKDKISRDAKASDDDNTFDLIPGIDEFNDIESEWDYWAGIEKQIDYEFGNFTARIGNATVTFRDNHIVKICEDNLIYTKVNGRRQFRISGRLVSRKEFEEFVLIGTDNQPEPPAVNDDEDKIFTFEVGKTYYGDDFDGVWTTDCKVIIHTLTVISRTAKTLTAVDEAGNTVTKKIVLGYSGTRESVNVLGVNDTTVQTVTISANHEYTPAIAAVSTEHYLDWMNAVENIELGLPIPDETPATPTVAELEAEIADNLRSIDEAYTELEAIEAEVGDEDCLTPQEHIDYLNDFIAECRERVNECREQIDSIKAEGEYAQAAAATDRIRKIDPDAEIIFAADEPTTERFILTTADNSCANCATAAEAEDLFYQLQADKPAPTVKPAARFELPYCIKFPNGEELWSLDGKWNHVTSDKYGADIYRNGIDDSREFVIRYSDDDKRWATAEEFFAEMVKRGACEIDEPPTDPLTAAQAEYDAAHAASIAATQAVIDADNALRHAKELERQAAERESAAFFKLGNLKREITDTVDRLNAAAPEDWSVVPDPDNKKFFVKAGGKSVAEIDSLALAKVLPPDKFFARFTPLTDDEPNQRYADQLYQEYLELLDMRDNLPDDPERLKVIDGLIRNLEREMLAARLDLPTSTPTTAC